MEEKADHARSQSFNSLLPQELHYLHLKTIHTVPFTLREIDIISCLLRGRRTSKIASLLSIGVRNVENRISVIKQKIGCASQDGIIDFIEKSGKLTLINNYYSSLLVQITFEKALKKISQQVANNLSCLLIYNGEEKEKNSYIRTLKKHLTLVKIKLYEVKEPQCAAQQINYKLNAHKTNNIIYCLPSNLSETKSKICDVFQLDGKLNSIIFLSTTGEVVGALPDVMLNTPRFHLIDERNYYIQFFKILKITLENFDLEKNIAEFNNQSIIFSELHSSTTSELNQEFIEKKLNGLFAGFLKKIKNPLIYGNILCLIIFCVWYYAFNSHKVPVNTSDSSTITTPHNVSAWNIPRQDHIFIGRQKQLNDLQNTLHNKKGKEDDINYANEPPNTHALAICAYAGLGGIGKTQLALQYIHHTKEPYTLRAWFPAENIDELRQKYIEFSKILGYKDDKLTNKAVDYVKDWLKEHPGWLIVYDNVEEYKDIEPFLPDSGGRVIITTRQRYWPSKFKVLTIDVMAEEEAVHLISAITNRSMEGTDKTKAQELVKTLGYLPLAIAQAGAYIQQNQVSVADYLKLYNDHGQELLKDNTLPKGVNSLPVAITWNISLAAIAKEAKANRVPLLAHEILTVCAYLSPEKISRQMLLTWFQKVYPDLTPAEVILNKEIQLLWKYSMITLDGEDYISVHRLVQTVVRSFRQGILGNIITKYQTLTPQWYENLLKALHTEFCRETKILEDEARQSELAPHLQMAVNHYQALWPISLPPPCFAQLLCNIGDEYHKKGFYKEAKFYWEKALVIFEKNYGLGHEEIASTLNKLGVAIRYLGDTLTAKFYHERALKIFEKRYGLEHIQVAKTLNHLGTAIRELGDAATAKALYERALTIDEKHYGSEHVIVARTLANIAHAVRYLGDPKKAKEYYERTLAIYEKHYGQDHVEVARTLNNLGTSIRELGDAKTAKELYKRALSIDEKYYGSQHVEFSRTLGNIANAIRELGDFSTAKKLYEQALSINENHYGKEHVEVARTLNNLGTAIRNLGDFKTAKLYHERALPINIKHYGLNHIEVARTFNNIAITLRELGDPAAAKGLHEQALIIQEKHYGKQHVHVTETLLELGITIKNLGNIMHSKEILEQAIAIRENFYGLNHVEVAKVLIVLVELNINFNNNQKAQDFAFRAYEIFRKTFGKSHFYTKRALKHIGYIVRCKILLTNLFSV